jgi:N-acylethanolamine-hydrolysing acid amidase
MVSISIKTCCILLAYVLLYPFSLALKVLPDVLPYFTVNFDEDASTRYNVIFKHYKKQIIEMENDLMYSISPNYRQLFQNTTNTDMMRQTNPEAYYAMQSLSNIINLPLWQTLLVNAVVDITSFCTSVVAVQSDGQIIHGRNLDFDFPTVLQPLVHRVYLQVDGRIVGEGICIAGYVGLYTAIRYKAFSLSYNVRMYPHTNMTEINSNIAREWTPGVIPAAQAIEIAILRNNSFAEAKAYLETQAVNTPCYFILAGIGNSRLNRKDLEVNGTGNKSYPSAIGSDNEGIVITRDPYGVNHTKSLDLGRNVWYLAQGNLDWWSTSDARYEATVTYLESVGREDISMETLVTQVLNQTGVLQWITIFTASMSSEINRADVYLTNL